jgi:hypothetical protein
VRDASDRLCRPSADETPAPRGPLESGSTAGGRSDAGGDTAAATCAESPVPPALGATSASSPAVAGGLAWLLECGSRATGASMEGVYASPAALPAASTFRRGLSAWLGWWCTEPSAPACTQLLSYTALTFLSCMHTIHMCALPDAKRRRTPPRQGDQADTAAVTESSGACGECGRRLHRTSISGLSSSSSSAKLSGRRALATASSRSLKRNCRWRNGMAES